MQLCFSIQMRLHLTPSGHLAALRDIFDSHNRPWHLLAEPKNDAKHPTSHRVAPTTENYLAQNVNYVKVEKS